MSFKCPTSNYNPDNDYIIFIDPNKPDEWDSEEQRLEYETFLLRLSIQSTFRNNYVEMMNKKEVQEKSEAERKKLTDEWLRAEERYLAQAIENLALEEENRSMKEAETRMTNPDHRKDVALLGV